MLLDSGVSPPPPPCQERRAEPCRLADRYLGAGRAVALPHGPPIGLAMLRTKKNRAAAVVRLDIPGCQALLHLSLQRVQYGRQMARTSRGELLLGIIGGARCHCGDDSEEANCRLQSIDGHQRLPREIGVSNIVIPSEFNGKADERFGRCGVARTGGVSTRSTSIRAPARMRCPPMT